MKKSGGLVYSTDQGRLCPGCHRAIAACVCKDRSRPRPNGNGRESGGGGDGIVRLRRQSQGRKGSGVTLVDGLPLTAAQMAELAKALKVLCGVGGAVKDGVIELQGDQRERIRPVLEARGFKVKLAGG